MAGFDPLFQQRLYAALDAAEKATGGRRNIVEGYRSPETQAQYYADYKGIPITWGGRTYQPNPAKLGRLAAPPGKSRHQLGQAADLGAGPVRDWVRAHANQFGLETLRGGVDQPHIQLARGAGITGPVSSSVAGTTPDQPVADTTTTAAAATPGSSLADAFSGMKISQGPKQSAGLGPIPPGQDYALPVTDATPPPAPTQTAPIDPTLGSLAEVFAPQAIGQMGNVLPPDALQGGFLPGQAKPLRTRPWT